MKRRTLADELLRQRRYPNHALPTEQLRWVMFPYCLARLEDGTYIPLNRHYKPLGTFGEAWVKYEDHPHFAVRLTKAQIRRLAYSGSASPEPRGWIYFYNDGCIPTDSPKHMAAYLDRLACLMKLKVIPVRYCAKGCGDFNNRQREEEPSYVTTARDDINWSRLAEKKRVKKQRIVLRGQR